MPNKISLSGAFPPVPTPFDDQGNLALQSLTENLERWNQYDLSGYVVLGSNGETVYLTEEEKLQVLETARQAIPAGKLFIAGTGCESTRQTIHLTQQAAERGADAALVLTPHYYGGRMTPNSMIRHYETLAEHSPIPVLLYNVTKFTHVDLDAATIARISQHPNIVGIKDSGGNVTKLADVVRLADDDFQVLAGSAGFFFAALAIGAVGGIMALANIAPQQCIDIHRLFGAGQWDKAAELQRQMVPVNGAVTARFGVAGLKAAMDRLGFYGGPVRPPLLELDEGEKQALQEILTQGGLLS